MRRNQYFSISFSSLFTKISPPTTDQRCTTRDSISCYEEVDCDEVGVESVQQMGHCTVVVAHLAHMWRHAAISSFIFTMHIEHSTPFALPLFDNTCTVKRSQQFKNYLRINIRAASLQSYWLINSSLAWQVFSGHIFSDNTKQAQPLELAWMGFLQVWRCSCCSQLVE